MPTATLRTCAWAHIIGRAQSRLTSRSRMTGASRVLRSDAWGSVSAVAPEVASCARALWRLGKRCIPRAAARACCLRCWRGTRLAAVGTARLCGRRLICACHARVARVSARSTSIWRHTKLSFWRITTSVIFGPAAAHAMGRINVWARLASAMPSVANFVTHANGIGSAAKWLAGIAPERAMPEFAKKSFRACFDKHEPRNHHALR